MHPRVWLLSLFLPLCLPAQAPVFRCTGTDQAVVFQAKPCPTGSTERLMSLQRAPTPVAGERPSELSDRRQNTRRSSRSRRPSARTNQQTRQQAQAEVQPKAPARRSRRPRAQASLAHPGCPPTYEDGGSYVVSKTWTDTPSGVRVKGTSGMRAAWDDYKSLPTRTYLKNAGKWPAHCPQ